MKFLPDLNERFYGPEIMDLPDADPGLLHTTIHQFALLNRLVTASRNLITRFILSQVDAEKQQHYTLLDLGAGGADLDIWIVDAFKKRGCTVDITAVDHDERVLAVARQQVTGYTSIRLVKDDVATMHEWGNFDFIFSNHLLHHLPDQQIAAVLTASVKQAKRVFLFNDIERGMLAYIGYAILCGLLCRKSLAFKDGLLSIRKSFTKSEWRVLLDTWQLGGQVNIVAAMPFRIVLTGQLCGGYKGQLRVSRS